MSTSKRTRVDNTTSTTMMVAAEKQWRQERTRESIETLVHDCPLEYARLCHVIEQLVALKPPLADAVLAYTDVMATWYRLIQAAAMLGQMLTERVGHGEGRKEQLIAELQALFHGNIGVLADNAAVMIRKTDELLPPAMASALETASVVRIIVAIRAMQATIGSLYHFVVVNYEDLTPSDTRASAIHS